MIKKILIANRGEIAVRIVRACAEMGIRSVAVYSEADRHALHVKRADEAHSIGADPLAGYLNPRALVNLAVESGCDALHPGYGFLSENAELAEICAERGIKFIGPSAQVIRRMGDKTEARRSMIAAGVPCTPGTVEFLLADGEVYFMEMNTRVQVEHTITEEITGIDVVREQIRIASGLELSVKQDDIVHRGYALQFRINAEDPKNNFLPSFGKITRYYAPGGPGVRTDTAIYTGYTIPPYYDSMCLKLIVWALTWEEALDRGLRALDDMRVQGVKTTAPYYQEILRNPEFRSGQFNTSFVESHPELTQYSIKRNPSHLAIAIATAIAAHAGL